MTDKLLMRMGIILMYLAISFAIPLPMESPPWGQIEMTPVVAASSVIIAVLLVWWSVLPTDDHSQNEPEEIS